MEEKALQLLEPVEGAEPTDQELKAIQAKRIYSAYEILQLAREGRDIGEED